MAIHGVNLGNWLVLEKWMGACPLAHAQAEDDRAWIDEEDATSRARLLEEHYRSYVTCETIAWLASVGVNLVRIPVPYHLFGTQHHIACVSHLDDAFNWAERYGMGILLDLHTVPLSQNGFDNGGYTGLCSWSRGARRMEWTLELLERLAARYAGRRALWGIEPLNEPASKGVYAANFAKNRSYPTRVARSWPISHRRLERFYVRFYERVRPLVGPEVRLVFHDQFSLGAWDRFDPGRGDANVWMDTHCYAAFSDAKMASRDLAGYLELVGTMAAKLERAAQHHPILVGEWCLANHAEDLQARPTHEVQEWYHTFSEAQLRAWDRVGGSCFWSLRVDAPHRENWSFTTCVERGWLEL